jgi:hypothetical protein
MVESLEKPLVDTAVKESQETVKQNEREVTEGPGESPESQGSWRTAALAWSMFASWLEVVVYVRCIDSVGEQTEVARTMADSAVRLASIPMCVHVVR